MPAPEPMEPAGGFVVVLEPAAALPCRRMQLSRSTPVSPMHCDGTTLVEPATPELEEPVVLPMLEEPVLSVVDGLVVPAGAEDAPAGAEDVPAEPLPRPPEAPEPVDCAQAALMNAAATAAARIFCMAISPGVG